MHRLLQPLLGSHRLQIQRDVLMQIFSNTVYFMIRFPDYFNLIWPQWSHWRGSNVEAVYRLAFANSTTATTQANFNTVGLLKGLCSQWLSDKEVQKEPKWWMSSSGPLKPVQNRKGQNKLRYPPKKKSFSKEKDCFFVEYLKFFGLSYFEAALIASNC